MTASGGQHGIAARLHISALALRATNTCAWAHAGHPLQWHAMFAARPFALNTASATTACKAARAITTKTTTIKG